MYERGQKNELKIGWYKYFFAHSDKLSQMCWRWVDQICTEQMYKNLNRYDANKSTW